MSVLAPKIQEEQHVRAFSNKLAELQHLDAAFPASVYRQLLLAAERNEGRCLGCNNPALTPGDLALFAFIDADGSKMVSGLLACPLCTEEEEGRDFIIARASSENGRSIRDEPLVCSDCGYEVPSRSLLIYRDLGPEAFEPQETLNPFEVPSSEPWEDARWIVAKFPGVCSCCRRRVSMGEPCLWSKEKKRVACRDCGTAVAPPNLPS